MASAALSEQRKAQVAALKVRKSEVLNLQPLTDLALRCVSRNFNLFAVQEQPFRDLTRPALASLLSYEPLQKLLRHPKFAHMMVTPHAGTAILDFRSSEFPWTREDVKRLCTRIQSHPDTLRGLEVYLQRKEDKNNAQDTATASAQNNMDVDDEDDDGASDECCWETEDDEEMEDVVVENTSQSPQLTTAQLHALLKSLPRLHTFRCDAAHECAQPGCGVTDKTLDMLNACCTQLKVLLVPGKRICNCSSAEPSSSTVSTGKSISMWGMKNSLKRLGSSLEVLYTDPPMVNKKDSQCFKQVLRYLPGLHRLLLPYPNLKPPSLLGAAPVPRPQLRYGLTFDKEENMSTKMAAICGAYPLCERLYVRNYEAPDLLPAAGFRALSQLIVTHLGGDNSGLQRALPILLARCPVRCLHLADISQFELDLSLLAGHSELLEELTLANINIANKLDHPVHCYQFKHVKKVQLTKLAVSPKALPAVQQLLSSPKLRELNLYHMALPSHVFTTLVQDSREQGGGALSSLERVALKYTFVEHQVLMDLFCHAPVMVRFQLSDAAHNSYQELFQFLNKHLDWEWDCSGTATQRGAASAKACCEYAVNW